MITTNEKIRTSLTIVFAIVFIMIGLLTANVPIYLEVLKQFTIPMGVILGGFFGNHIIKNNKNNRDGK